VATYAGVVEHGANEKGRAEVLAAMDKVLEKEVHIKEAQVRVISFDVKRD
jgi:hypothetical protein